MKAKSIRSKRKKATDIKDPERLDAIITKYCEGLPSLIPGLKDTEDFELRMAAMKRDLVYIQEVTETVEEAKFCMQFALGMHFGIKLEPSLVDLSNTLNKHLKRRLDDLVATYRPEPIRRRSGTNPISNEAVEPESIPVA
jgi:hypothetical protein